MGFGSQKCFTKIFGFLSEILQKQAPLLKTSISLLQVLRGTPWAPLKT